MQNIPVRKANVLLIGAAMVLAGCFGGNAGGGPAGPADITDDIDAVKAMMPTTNMPTELKASYEGGMAVDVLNADAPDPDNPDYKISADLEIGIDWDETMGVNADITGQATNFQGESFVPGDEGNFALDGSLTVVEGSGGIAKEDIPGMDLGGGVSSPDISTGALSFQMTGTLTEPINGASGTASLLFGGIFYGDDAAGAAGTVGGPLYQDEDMLIPDGVVAGEFFLLRKPD